MNGTLKTAGQIDAYDFSLSAGYSYEFDLFGQGSGEGTLVAGNLVLVGVRSASESSGGVARVTYTPTVTATYHVQVSASAGNIGSYTLVESPADDYAATNATTGKLLIGDSATGMVLPINDDDRFAVTLTAGFAYQFDLLGQGSGGGTLSGGSLNLVGVTNVSAGSSGDARITYTPTTSGTYYLDVSAGGTNTGSYTLKAASADDYAATNATTGKLLIGDSATGMVLPINDDDRFAVTLTAGFAYQFDLLGQGSGGGTLSGGSLNLVGVTNVSAGSSGDARITYTPTTSGTYYLDVSAGGTNTGSYTLKAASADDYAATNATTGKLLIGDSATGMVLPINDDDRFAVTLTAGFAYQFDLLGQGSGGGTLSGGSLNLVGVTNVSAGSSGDARITYTPTTSGTYYLDVSAGGTNTGSYTLKAASADDYAATNATTGKLLIGDSATGMVLPINDDDRFAVTLTAGFAYQFDLLGQGSGGGTLSGGSLNLVGVTNVSAGSSGDARITYTPTTSGTYYLDVSAGGTNTGSYTLKAASADDYAATNATTGKLLIGDSATGMVLPINDDDRFAVTLTAGFAYQFDLLGQGSGGGTLSGGSLNLVGVTNVSAGSSGDARITYTPTTSGTYYLDVSASGSNTGSYTLSATTGSKNTDVTIQQSPLSQVMFNKLNLSSIRLKDDLTSSSDIDQIALDSSLEQSVLNNTLASALFGLPEQDVFGDHSDDFSDLTASNLDEQQTSDVDLLSAGVLAGVSEGGEFDAWEDLLLSIDPSSQDYKLKIQSVVSRYYYDIQPYLPTGEEVRAGFLAGGTLANLGQFLYYLIAGETKFLPGAGTSFGNILYTFTAYSEVYNIAKFDYDLARHASNEQIDIDFRHVEEGLANFIAAYTIRAAFLLLVPAEPLLALALTILLLKYAFFDADYGTANGDVHLKTFSGLYFDFQAIGEFVLAKSNVPGDNYQIQIRLQPWFNSQSVSTITQVAVAVGSDRLTFDLHRPSVVYVNGLASVLSASNPIVQLNGGFLAQMGLNEFIVQWNTGEILKVEKFKNYFKVDTALGPDSTPGSIHGLLGSDSGKANDFQLADGTVLQQPLRKADLYGAYADAWRVTQGTSLFDYGPGETTATFTDPTFPRQAVTLADLPTGIVAQAAALVAAASIPDPNIAAGAELDYIATNDPSFITGAAQSISGSVTLTTAATITSSNPTSPVVGVTQVANAVTEAASATTSVTFKVYLTSASASDTVVAYAVFAPNTDDLGPAAFGGMFPSGTTTIAAGQTAGSFTVNLSSSVLGVLPSSTLEVQISTPNGEPVFASTAQTTIVNNRPVPGRTVVPVLSTLADIGTFTQAGSAYTLDLGSLVQGEAVAALQFAVENVANSPADSLGGTFSFVGSNGFTFTGDGPLVPLVAAGSSGIGNNTYSGVYATVDTTTLGSHSATLTFTPIDVNASGYQQTLPTLTLTITDDVLAPASALSNLSITAPSKVTVQLNKATTVGAVSISETGSDTSETFTVTLSDTAGLLSAAGSGVSGAGTTALTVAGTLTQVNTALLSLTDTDPNAVGDTITVVAADSLGNTVGPASIAVTVQSRSDLASPVVTIPGTSATAIDFGSVRVGSNPTTRIVVTNAAQLPAEDLDVSVSATGGATATGAIFQLPAGQSDGTDLDIGLMTGQPGSLTGSVTLSFSSDGVATDGFPPTVFASQTIAVTGTVYAEAQATVSLPNPVVVHVGDTGAINLSVTNTSGDVENLNAYITGTTGGVSTPLGTLTTIAAGGAAFIPVTFSTSSAGAVTGTVTLSFASDGSGTDDAPISPIGSQTVAVTTTVDNYAALGLSASTGQLTFDGTEYVLDLGTVAFGADPLSVLLTVSNTAGGPADLLSGNVAVSNGTGFSNAGPASFNGLASGSSSDMETVNLASGTAGTFSETLTVHSTGSNASGYSGALPDQRVRITGTVASVASTIGSGPDNLVLDISEDAYLGDAQYTVSVDGQQIGGVQTTTAAHSAGEFQVLNVRGTFGDTPHAVTINYLNDAYALPYSASADRNFYVTGASYNGVALPSPSLAQFASGPETFSFGGVLPTVTIGTGADILALAVSEDEYQGDAEFTVSVDGQQIGGMQTTNASHAAGQSEMIDVLGDFGAGQHVVRVNFINDRYSMPIDPAMDRNLYVDSATINGALIGNSTLSVGSPVPQSFSFGGPPATVTVGTGPDTLALAVAEDGYLGDAEFTVSVDGTQIGGLLSISASHAMGQSQTLDVMGRFATGPHTVSVDFVNDAYNPPNDRNLYVDNATINGTTIGGSTLALFSQGPQSFSFGGPAAPITIGAGTDTLTFLLSEDAYLGDAQFTLSVDGSQIGGLFSASASHAAGQDQILNVLGTFGAGSHTVSVDFLNDLYAGAPATDRNLYVDGATINGNAVANSNLALYAGGPQSFTFTEHQAALPVMPV